MFFVFSDYKSLSEKFQMEQDNIFLTSLNENVKLPHFKCDFFGHLPFQFSHTIKQEKNLLDFISLISKKMFVCLPNVSFISLRIHVKSPSLILCSKSKSRSCSSNASILSSKFNRCKKDSIVYFSMRILSVENGSTYTNKN